jgi:hypothetical protein
MLIHLTVIFLALVISAHNALWQTCACQDWPALQFQSSLADTTVLSPGQHSDARLSYNCNAGTCS